MIPDHASSNAPSPARFTAFDGHRQLASGAMPDVALAVKRAAEGGAAGPLLVFDDATGRVVDVDTRGTDAEVVARLSAPEASSSDASDSYSADATAVEGGAPADEEPTPRRRGRPRLGVVAREVTLLPRHWEWLAEQRGGASVALRRLVDEARRAGEGADRARRARDAAYRFMHAAAGDLPGLEEAARALFADDAERFRALTAGWPGDVRDHAAALAFPGDASAGAGPLT